MAREGMKLGQALLIAGAAAALAGEATAHSQTGTARGTWVCSAYGYGGHRNTWQTVTGERLPSQAVAKDSAMHECTRKLNGCQRSGCWQSE